MDSQYRKLLSDSEDIIKSCCDDETDSSGYCVPKCWNLCSGFCPVKLPPPPPPPPIFAIHLEHKSKKILISTLSISLTIFILVCCYVAYVKFFSGSVRRRRQREDDQDEEQRTEIEREFLDEDHGPMVDHPIWYIRTVGLQPSVISSISVCKYKRGDGLVESTDCSICLSEFEDDETLRLLPKCSHAFHIPCIDTWLRSHTNCPVCRAPIVANTNRATTCSEANVGSSSSGEEGLVEVAEQVRTERVADREIEGEDHDGSEEEDELRVDNRRKRNEVFDEDENGMQPLRRSISLDSLSALKISQVLSNLPTHESHQNCDSRMVEANESHTGIVSRRGGINQGLLSFMASSSVGRSFQSFQIGPSSIKRSFSCSAKLFLPRHNRS